MLVIAIAFTPITIYLINVLNRPLGKYAKGRQEGLEALTAIAQDTIGGAYIEKVYNLSEVMQQKFEQADDYALENTLKSQKRTAITARFLCDLWWISGLQWDDYSR
jgi:ABC-type multidrug transport system fused ATPase/permease subunit